MFQYLVCWGSNLIFHFRSCCGYALLVTTNLDLESPFWMQSAYHIRTRFSLSRKRAELHWHTGWLPRRSCCCRERRCRTVTQLAGRDKVYRAGDFGALGAYGLWNRRYTASPFLELRDWAGMRQHSFIGTSSGNGYVVVATTKYGMNSIFWVEPFSSLYLVEIQKSRQSAWLLFEHVIVQGSEDLVRADYTSAEKSTRMTKIGWDGIESKGAYAPSRSRQINWVQQEWPISWKNNNDKTII